MANHDCGKNAAFELQLFGPFSARICREPLTRFYSRKGQWLLALLALRHGRAVERSWLAGTLWPEAPESQALYYLRRELMHLREALGSAAGRLLSPSPRSLSLDLRDASVDVLEFDAAIRRGDPPSLEEAVGLYSGVLLEGCCEDWISPERASREAACLKALESLADRACQQGAPVTAARYLRRLVRLDPLEESAHRRLMEALAAAGNHAAALVSYEELRRILCRELDAQPAEETELLFERIQSEARRRASGPAELQTGVSPRRSTLPRPLTRLIGRAEEVRATRERLREARLITITGTGGVGKSRLAVEVAEQAVGAFPDGVTFVDLAPVGDPALVVSAAASALHVREVAGEALLQTLCTQLQDSVLLLILDNCEHVVQECVNLTQQLLVRCPHLRILATSRQPLRVTGEVAWSLPSLATPAVDAPGEAADPAALLEFEAVQLFVERAREVARGFDPSPAQLPVIAQICSRLDGIPLAIELAAARVRALSLDDIAARLDDRFRLLTEGCRAALPRHQTLRATMEWSYTLLSPAEQRLLHQLGVFSGGWSLQAAETVCATGADGGDVLGHLAALVDKSLVAVDRPAGCHRFRLLETVRAFSLEHADAELRTATARKHAAYFTALAEQVAPDLNGARQRLLLDELENEIGNYRAAVGWSLGASFPATGAPGDGGLLGLRLAVALTRFWWERGHCEEGRRWLEAALAAPAGEQGISRARVLESLGLIAWFQADYPAAVRFLEQGYSLHAALGEHAGMGMTLMTRGLVESVQGNVGGAMPRFLSAEKLFRQVEHAWGLATTKVCIADAYALQGELELAASLYEESGSEMRRVGDVWMLGVILINEGLLAVRRNEPARAAELFRESLHLLRDTHENWHIARALEGMAMAAAQHPETKGRLKGAVRLLGAGAAARQKIGAPLLPLYEEPYERSLAAARVLLGETDFAAAWEDGRSMCLASAVEAALKF